MRKKRLKTPSDVTNIIFRAASPIPMYSFRMVDQMKHGCEAM